MSNKRRDSRGRILRTGESQRQDGRYVYKYMDAAGKTRYIYSWKSEATDKLPTGKRDELALRESIRKIQKDLEGDIKPYGNETSVFELVERYLAQKTGVRNNTRANYGFVLNILKKEHFAALPIDKVRLSTAKAWLIQLQKDGRGYSTIHCVRGVVRPAFQMAVDDDLLRKNPFDFQLATVVVNDSATREAISRKQERDFLAFVESDRHYRRYYDGIYILFKTGLRISEFTGLTMNDIDMKARTISVNCQLQRTRDKHGYIDTTGKVVIPCEWDGAYSFSEGLACVKKDGKFGFINTIGKLVIPFCEWDNEYGIYFNDEGLAKVEKDGKCGYIDTTGELISPCEWDKTSIFREGLSRVEKDSKYGYIDTTGELISPCEWDEAWLFSEGLSRVEKDDKYGYIDTTGKLVIPCEYDSVAYSNGYFAVIKDEYLSVYDNDGNKVY